MNASFVTYGLSHGCTGIRNDVQRAELVLHKQGPGRTVTVFAIGERSDAHEIERHTVACVAPHVSPTLDHAGLKSVIRSVVPKVRATLIP